MAAALATGALLATQACSGGEGGTATDADTAAASAAQQPLGQRLFAERPLARQTVTPPTSPSASPALTEDRARTALITEADLEDDWTQVKNAETWQDSLLIGQVDAAAFLTGKTGAADCQRLLDALYDDTLLGRPSGASALTGFQEGQSRLLYQVAAYERADLDKSLDWLESLPETCDQFTVTGGSGGQRTVQVVEASLPEEGDVRQGLTVTVKGTTDGAPVTLTLDVAAVRVGTDAITVTNGGLAGADHDSTVTAVQQGTQRLKDVLAGRTPTASPGRLG
ncbi:hypothetical protein ACIBBD_09840 [Streptomyces sp. NPDC051315]|uniref:hypothetical protein n=1 Tax=Streptomyces sp. NPDC051315 TaxID=3365650 RepID=UPI00378CC5CB